MITALDVVELITVGSGFDRWLTADEPTRAAWLYMLAPYEPDEAKRAVVKYFSEPDRKNITPAAVVDLIKTEKRLQPHQIEADVRSARARQLISADWPAGQSLPEDVARRLHEIRTGETMRALPYDPSVQTDRSIDWGTIKSEPA